jgi:hypothetical protein
MSEFPLVSRRGIFRASALTLGSSLGLGNQTANAVSRKFEKHSSRVTIPNRHEDRHPGGVLSFAKSLPKDDHGIVEASAYRALLAALVTRNPEAVAALPFTGSTATALVNPVASFDLPVTAGMSASDFACTPAADPTSKSVAAEMVELYWAALLRDVPFGSFKDSSIAQLACEEIAQFSDFTGPHQADGGIKPHLLFRPAIPAALRDAFISQFLLLDIPSGALVTNQQVAISDTPRDWLTTFEEWLSAQAGQPVVSPAQPISQSYLRTPRHLAVYVFRDHPAQAFFNAALILDGAGTARSPDLPYAASSFQRGFVTYGFPHLLTLLARAADGALRASWYQKWLIYRRLRPEELGGRVHLETIGGHRFGIAPELLKSEAVRRTRSIFGSGLLPQAYPTGAPAHPSYPAGHAAIAGACAAVLKAWYPTATMPDPPVAPSANGSELREAPGPPAAVSDELDKLAGNIAFGRSLAGVHFRSDNTAGLRLGERVGLAILREDRRALPEMCPPYRVRCFDGVIRAC